jgi:hypothetical protein
METAYRNNLIIIRIYSLFRSKGLSTSIKLTLHECTDQISNNLRLSNLPLKIAVPTKQGSLHHLKFSKVHTSQ